MATTKRQRALRPARVFKNKKARAKQSTTFFRFIFIFFALIALIVAISGYFLHYKLSLLSFEALQLHTFSRHSDDQLTRLKIASSSIDVPIQTAQVTNKHWPTFESAVTHMMASALPLEGGNIVLYAFNHSGLLNTLDKVKVGDVIILQTRQRKSYEYIVQEVTTVSPSDSQALPPIQSEAVTLFTNSGFLNSKRLVVRAIPIRVPSF
jgi:LPXTG-site transpeptidase (sortase) family protein